MPWMSVLDPQRRVAAATIAREVIVRSTDPEYRSVALAAAGQQTQFPSALRWDPYGIAAGDAGLAVLCAHMDAWLPGEGWG